MNLMTQRRIGGLAVAIVIASGGGRAVAQNGSQFRDWKGTALADSVQARPRAACATLVALTGYEFSIVTATPIAASAEAPEYCRVIGQIQPEIRFEVSLPASWNGRLYVFGNGGYAGESLDAPGRVANVRRGITRGFAVAQMNTGHDAGVEPLGSFAANSQKFLDYAYRGLHVTVLTAKKILQTYYDGTLRHSYFDGCSTGGRQGLIAAQRFPEDFDGIVNGAPVLDFSGTMIDYASNQRALKAAPIAAEKLKILAEAVAGKCDAVDGLKDGLIDDPRACAFKPSADLPKCAGDVDGPSCFTPTQIATVETIYGGVKRSGAEFFPGWPLGAENAWTPWFVGGQQGPVQIAFGETFFKYMAFGRPNTAYDWLTFNVDADLDKIQWARTVLDATDPDLSRFKTRGGKIVSYFGWADPALNPMMGIKYYESVTQKMGPSTTDFYRLFMVPGMYHCSGGTGVSTFDALTPLVEWVEKGVAPRAIVGSRLVDGKVVRTRPLCPYPQVAQHTGTGSIDEAASFSCAPARGRASTP
jgi:tannase/feruloyl esterase